MVKNVPDSDGFCGCIRFQTVAILKAGLKDSLHKPRMSICVHLRFRPVSETTTKFRMAIKTGTGRIYRKCEVILEPDVREYFPDSESVNNALRSLIMLIPQKQNAAVDQAGV